MNVLIVEDEPLYADHVQLVVEDLGHEVIGSADSADAALALSNQTSPDLVLMDVNIVGAYDGVETAEMICSKYNCPVIFLTAQQDEQTFQRANRIGPINFLLKPFDDLQLKRAIQLVTANTPNRIDVSESAEEESDEGSLYVKTGHRLRKVPISEITSVASDGRYCEIYTTGNRYLVRMTMQQLMDRLPADRFLRTHRGHVVNETFVDSVDLRDSEIVLHGGRRVPLAKRERESFLRRIERA